ncbi:MAG: hypothetical protein ACOC0D_07745 [Spirochaeta sp.]
MIRIYLLAAMVSIMLVMACSTPEETAAVNTGNTEAADSGSAETSEQLTTIRGVPTTFGNEPRTYVAIVLYDGENPTDETYYVHPEHQDDLRTQTGELLRLEGYVHTGESSFFEARLHDAVFVPVSYESAK